MDQYKHRDTTQKPLKQHLRHIVLPVVWLCLAAVSMSAQPRLRVPEMYVGVHGGVIASMVQFSPTVANMSPITQAVVLGGNGGLVFRYSAQKCCAVQVELNYMQRGWREANSDGSYARAIHYIEVPFLMHIYFGKPSFRGFINLGPQIGYCVYDDMGKGSWQTESTHQYAALDKKFDWGAAGGLGFYYRSKNAGLYQLEARFNYSLGTIFANSATDYFSQSNSMNLSVNLAWMWEIKPKKKQVAPAGWIPMEKK